MAKISQVIKDPREMQIAVGQLRAKGAVIGLVPTMGALHEGHLSLVRAAFKECSAVVATIFVNPTQFAPSEDLKNYPRPLKSDLQKLESLNVDYVFVPSDEAMYPPGFSTYVIAPQVAKRLEGEKRPTHFQGVTTVVAKLFNIVPAHYAYFGQKDFQQALVIRRMAEDLDFNIQIRVCPIVRDPDGLAMSSRNVYLSPDERIRALSLHKCLQVGRETIRNGETNSGIVLSRMRKILNDGDITDIDYVVAVDPETLVPVDVVGGNVVLLVAARVGKTRLIDNLLLE